jgi:4-azaleucine resistance transporter AzlC
MEITYEQTTKPGFKEGAAAAFPIMIGYLPAAMAFGLLSKTTGISLWESLLFSVMVFAGASQFMALNLIVAGAAAGEIILATLLLNFRHFLMSASLAARLQGEKSKWLPVVAFGVTDETFSVASLRPEKPSVPFLLVLEGASYGSWVGGTVLGFLAGAALPTSIQESMGIALYAMFAAILVPEIRKAVKVGILAGSSGAINAILYGFKLLPSGWSLIVATVAAAAVGAFLFKKDEEVQA